MSEMAITDHQDIKIIVFLTDTYQGIDSCLQKNTQKNTQKTPKDRNMTLGMHWRKTRNCTNCCSSLRNIVGFNSYIGKAFKDIFLRKLVNITDHEMLQANREHSGSVVECLTRDRGATGSSLIGVTVLCP